MGHHGRQHPQHRQGVRLEPAGSPVQEIRHTCAQVIAKIAGARSCLWPSLVTDLQNNMATGDPGKRQSTLEALGYICEEIEHEHLQEADVNAMLTAIVQGMRRRRRATRSASRDQRLVNAMYFAEGTEREQEELHHAGHVRGDRLRGRSRQAGCV